ELVDSTLHPQECRRLLLTSGTRDAIAGPASNPHSDSPTTSATAVKMALGAGTRPAALATNATSVKAASAVDRAVGVLMVVAAIVYLSYFVGRGWIPHDEGMLGQSAERVLRGDIPHVDYEEMYTGGLSWLYAV